MDQWNAMNWRGELTQFCVGKDSEKGENRGRTSEKKTTHGMPTEDFLLPKSFKWVLIT